MATFLGVLGAINAVQQARSGNKVGAITNILGRFF